MVSCAKGTMIAANSILCTLGLCFGIAALVLYYQPSLAEKARITSYEWVLIGAATLGFLLFVVSFFGLAGAGANNSCLLITYIVLVILLLLVSVPACGLFFYAGTSEPGKDAAIDAFSKAFKAEMKEYGKDEKKREDIQKIQQEFHCCGCNNVSDYKNKDIVGTESNDGGKCEPDYQWTGCCRGIIERFLKDKKPMVMGIAGGLAAAILIQLLGVVFACVVISHIKSGHAHPVVAGGPHRM